MGGREAGGFRRMLRKLTSDVEVLDADDLSEDAERSGGAARRGVRVGSGGHRLR